MLSEGAWVTPTVRLERPLGSGGMGSVWVAEHTTLRTQVVVKLMRPDLAKDPETLYRFSREAAAAANVKSPHVVSILDHGVAPDGSPFITMELLEGEDLGARLARGPIPPDEAAVILAQTCKALARAHERGIVHRDIKPQNVFLCASFGETFVKVLDFGIAKAGGDLQVGLETTSTGSVMGTPYYMSPEQALGHKTLDYRTDLWAVGVMGFEMLTGQKPFAGETIGALAVAICTKPLPMPSGVSSALGSGVDAWFARACAREPADRFASAKELADAFAAAVSGPTSLGLAKTVPSLPPQAIPALASTTNGPTSRAPIAQPRPASSRAAAFVAVMLAGATLTFGAVLVYSGQSVRNSGHRREPPRHAASAAASAAPSATIDGLVPVPIESLPSATSEATEPSGQSPRRIPELTGLRPPPHPPATTTHAPTAATQTRGSVLPAPASAAPARSAHPAASFDRNSID